MFCIIIFFSHSCNTVFIYLFVDNSWQIKDTFQKNEEILFYNQSVLNRDFKYISKIAITWIKVRASHWLFVLTNPWPSTTVQCRSVISYPVFGGLWYVCPAKVTLCPSKTVKLSIFLAKTFPAVPISALHEDEREDEPPKPPSSDAPETENPSEMTNFIYLASEPASTGFFSNED